MQVPNNQLGHWGAASLDSHEPHAVSWSDSGLLKPPGPDGDEQESIAQHVDGQEQILMICFVFLRGACATLQLAENTICANNAVSTRNTQRVLQVTFITIEHGCDCLRRWWCHNNTSPTKHTSMLTRCPSRPPPPHYRSITVSVSCRFAERHQCKINRIGVALHKFLAHLCGVQQKGAWGEAGTR